MENQLIFTPRQMRLLFSTHHIQPTKSFVGDGGHAHAWLLPGGNYLIEIHDFTGTWYEFHPNADGMERRIVRSSSSPG